MKLAGNILTVDGWVCGVLHVENGLIAALEAKADIDTGDASYIIPGFIDLHVHGGGGRDTMEAGDAVKVLARSHACFGTTSVLATTMTATKDDILAALYAIRNVMQEPTDGADILGVHLEGPFINKDKLGAQPNHTLLASKAMIEEFHAIAPLKVITIAPEFEENLEIIPWLNDKGIRVQIGHTLANYGQCICALKAGAQSFTHLYNAMSPLRHRDPGAVGAAMAKAFYCEIIPDFIHSEKGAVLAAMRAIPRLYAVTDGTAACGMPDGQYKLGENDVFKRDGAVRLDDGTLAGSALTLDQALRNFVMLGDSLQQASYRLSQYQADYLGLEDRGRLLPGLRADINVLDHNLQLQRTYVAGKCIVDHCEK